MRNEVEAKDKVRQSRMKGIITKGRMILNPYKMKHAVYFMEAE